MKAVAALRSKNASLEAPSLGRELLRPGLDMPRPTVSEDLPSPASVTVNGTGHSFGQVAVHAPQVTGNGGGRSVSCPLLPRACPYGGACHTCPAAGAAAGG